MSLKVNSAETRPGVFTISPIGSLDGNTYKVLEGTVESVLKQLPDVIIFDFEFLDYINSMGVRVLLKTKKNLKKIAARSCSCTCNLRSGRFLIY